MNRVRFPFRATSRTPDNPIDSLVRHWVRGAVLCPLFSLVGRLPSTSSAGGSPLLFGRFDGTMQPSDSPLPFMSDFGFTPSPTGPPRLSSTGVNGVSRFSRVEFPYMLGVWDCAESTANLR